MKVLVGAEDQSVHLIAFRALEGPIFETFLHWCHPYYFHLRGTLSSKLASNENAVGEEWDGEVTLAALRLRREYDHSQPPTPGLGPLPVMKLM